MNATCLSLIWRDAARMSEVDNALPNKGMALPLTIISHTSYSVDNNTMTLKEIIEQWQEYKFVIRLGRNHLCRSY
jgi:hypothetical protein